MSTIQKNYHVDEDLQRQADIILETMGLNTSTAITMFLTRIVSEEKFPFTPEVVVSPTRAKNREKILEQVSRLPNKTLDFSNTEDVSEFFDD